MAVSEWWGAGMVICLECRLAYGPADATATHYLLLQRIAVENLGAFSSTTLNSISELDR